MRTFPILLVLILRTYRPVSFCRKVGGGGGAIGLWKVLENSRKSRESYAVVVRNSRAVTVWGRVGRTESSNG